MTESSQMNRTMLPRLAFALLAVCLAGAITSTASAADVAAELSQRETFVGLPVTLRIEIRDATDYEQPELPQVDGLEIQSLGSPSQSSHIRIIGGRRTERTTITFSYRVTPQREGTFTIAPITVTADGLSQIVSPGRLVASKSEASDLLIAEIESTQTEAYVGEPVELTLKIWVRPFRSEEYEVVLSEGDMWNLIAEQTDWGVFQERLDELAGSNRRPGGQEVLRKDSEGNEHSYYLYEIDATIYPKRPGAIDSDPVRVVARYPTELARSRSPFSRFFDDDFPFPRSRRFGDPFSSPFGDRLTIRSTRPVVAEAQIDAIDVEPIPTAGRPADFRGAVGQYQIAAEATPTEVPAGDPITFRIGIVGTGPMDLVRAPPLSELPELTGDFQVPDESLPGFVEDDRKVFSTTIRPRHEGVTEIPSIPFTYFDPDAEKFVTVRSDPIPVQVSKADTLALDSIAGVSQPEADRSAAPAGEEGRSDAAVTPVLEHTASVSELLQHQPPRPLWSWSLIAWAAAPPLLVLLLALLRHRSAVLAFFATWGSSKRICRRRVARAETPVEVAAALRALVAQRYRLRSEQANSAAVVGVLRRAGHRDLAIHLERLLDRCERDARDGFGGGHPGLEELKKEARRWVDQWPRHRLPPGRRSQPAQPVSSQTRGRSTTSSMVLLFALAQASGVAATAPNADAATARSAEAVELTREQQQTLLAEAQQRYEQARREAAQGEAAAKEFFSEAAEKYRAVVEAGVQNSELYFYLGNAYLQSGEAGRAVAQYRRALQLRPSEERYQRNLAFAERALRRSSDAASEWDEAAWSSAPFKAAGSLLERWISMRQARWIGVAGWLLLWGAIALRLYRVPLPWKSFSLIGLLVAVTATTAYGSRYRELSRDDLAVVVGDTVMLRAGDGEGFEVTAELQQAEGKLVEVLDRRAGWFKIRFDAENTGWVTGDAVEVVSLGG